MADASLTVLLNNWSSGDRQAGDVLAPLIYDELHRIAKRLFRSERSDHTLQPTALVHEAFCHLIDAQVSWQNRAHFYALAARMMRRLLVNYANERRAAKRGGDVLRVTLTDLNEPAVEAEAVLLDLDAALTSLAEIDARKAEIVQLQYFGGLSFQELEEVTGLSSSTLDRELRFSRAWLRDRLSS